MEDLATYENALEAFIVKCRDAKDTHGYAYATGYLQSVAAGMAHELMNQGKDISWHTEQLLAATDCIPSPKEIE